MEANERELAGAQVKLIDYKAVPEGKFYFGPCGFRYIFVCFPLDLADRTVDRLSTS
jgi:hypothetical protein